MNDYERKQLLERVRRDGATVGASIPERIEVQGDPVDLREFVFEIKRRETVPQGERERVEEAKRNLRRERLQRLQRLEDEEEAASIPFEEGEALAESVVGIDRALHALEGLGPEDVQAEADRQAAADRKRWMSFLRQALGHEDDSHGTRGRSSSGSGRGGGLG